MSESRVRENRMHGSIGGRWQNGTSPRGPLVPGRWPGGHHDGLVGTSTGDEYRRTSGLPHHVEVESLLLAYQRVGPGLSAGEADDYVREMARLGELMGARSPVTSARELRDWVLHHPEARATPEARSAVRFLARLPLPLAARPAYAVLFCAAASLVPWGWRMQLGLLVPGPVSGRLACEPAARTLCAAMGWALGPSPALTGAAARARRSRQPL